MFKVGTGWSDDPDTKLSAEDALTSAVNALDGQTPRAALVYAAVDMDLAVAAQVLRDRFPDILIAGCSTDGEIASGEGFIEDSLVITLFASDSIRFAVGCGSGAIADPKGATKAAVDMAQAGEDGPPALTVALLEGLGTNIHHLLDGLRDATGPDAMIVGGAAGDQLRFEGTKQLCNDQVMSDGVVVLMVFGALNVSTGVSTGYVPLGQPHKVTKADGPVVHCIDDRPAADLYAEYLQQPSVFFPLAVKDESRKSLVLSSPLNFDAETGALHLVNPVAEGSTVQIATASRQEIIDAARNAAGQAVAGFDGGRIDAALLFSCGGRRATLGTRTREEYDGIREIVGHDVPTAGFYCYGEISPDTPGGPPLTHTNAFVAVFIGEKEG
ncbi:FIST C-terminal domain-containing protein (plasmid) [Aliiroseovarius crassostreae]|uniref:FIST C-terminal domain-containing protein n=1 Tax=Aliiroseovarius crassostreae TaxID=154981 RepID=A0A9Q9M111_9RHOB|nr:FIST N-terminal domain-containing protein [Aliiroseovarius crassostreae]UWP93891.1 FIST C-terminal domain-containing protein [Aliiroseovarius crassostreae]UWP97038.1 FIST C-terminal domain-containing protein [Aliiroseovarius crassostreae]UWQ03568.1 FIST C-terminal domain-containing protein [Aliiroseovarius crassostreae]